MSKKTVELDEFHYHEVLDRAHVIATMVDELLIDHPAVVAHDELRASVTKLSEAAMHVYQQAGIAADYD